MQFVMYSGKLHIYQHSFFITYDICVCKHVFPITILQNIMCKCAKSFSFWGTSSPDTLPGLCPWTSLGDFRPRTSLLAIVYCRPLWGNSPPKKNRNTPPKQFDETEEPEARIHALPSRTKSLDFTNLAAITSVNFAVSVHTLTSKQPHHCQRHRSF